MPWGIRFELLGSRELMPETTGASTSAWERRFNSYSDEERQLMKYRHHKLDYTRPTPRQQSARLSAFQRRMTTRRSVRDFLPDPVPRALIERAIATAGMAPSGANQQPWRFVVVTDPGIKRQIRLAAEEEERRNYADRMSTEWKTAIAPLGTDWHKEFLEIAPALIVVFQINYSLDENGDRIKHYYVSDSVGLATGFLIAALHHAGLATLTHTPSPMNFLNTVLERPRNERPFVLMPVGYPAEKAQVPEITKKPLDEIVLWK